MADQVCLFISKCAHWSIILVFFFVLFFSIRLRARLLLVLFFFFTWWWIFNRFFFFFFSQARSKRDLFFTSPLVGAKTIVKKNIYIFFLSYSFCKNMNIYFCPEREYYVFITRVRTNMRLYTWIVKRFNVHKNYESNLWQRIFFSLLMNYKNK